MIGDHLQERVELNLEAGRLHALRRGPQAGAPVFCVPGLSANARSFDLIAQRLAERGRQVIALDLRGRGFSPPPARPGLGWRGHALDVLAAATSLGFAQFDLLGHSMGAFVSMQAAALEPARIRRLVLIDAAGVPDPSVGPPILAAVQRLGAVYPSADAYAERVRRGDTATPWEELWKAHYLYELDTVPGGVSPRTSREAVLADVLYGAGQDPKALWRALRMPALLVRAARPLVARGGFVVGEALRDAFLAAVPAARAVDVDANHYGVMAAAAALRAIDEFLAS